jgi:hypothetical protein
LFNIRVVTHFLRIFSHASLKLRHCSHQRCRL